MKQSTPIRLVKLQKLAQNKQANNSNIKTMHNMTEIIQADKNTTKLVVKISLDAPCHKCHRMFHVQLFSALHDAHKEYK